MKTLGNDFVCTKSKLTRQCCKYCYFTTVSVLLEQPELVTNLIVSLSSLEGEHESFVGLLQLATFNQVSIHLIFFL